MAINVSTIPKMVRPERKRVTFQAADVREALMERLSAQFPGALDRFDEVDFKMSDVDAVFVFESQ